MKIITRKPLPPNQSVVQNPPQVDKGNIPDTQLPETLEEKVQLLQPYMDKNSDIISRPIYLEGETRVKAQLLYLNKVVNEDHLNNDILKPLMIKYRAEGIKELNSENLIEMIYQSSITVGIVNQGENLNVLVHNLFDGMTILMVDGIKKFLILDIHGGEHRNIDAPPAEQSMRGSREGFIERLDINISLIRRRLKDPNLIVQKTTVGRRTRTQVAVIYIEDIADPHVVEEVKQRIQSINIDGLVASGYIEQFIEDDPYSLFPQAFITERPDKAVTYLLEGRIVIIADNTPLSLVVPVLFVQFLQASEDYYERTHIANYSRLLRYIALLIAISFPALYIALLSYQPELIPYDFLISFSKARTAVPFPVVVEAIIMEVIIQLVIEAGLRLPQQIGQTVGVVAGIILGQAAISAKLASPIIILIISVSIICTYALPAQSLVLTTRVLRPILMLLAGSFGLFGLSFGWIVFQTHLIGLESMGVPYFSPLAPTRFADFKDAFTRTFMWKMNQRPVSIPGQDRTRQQTGREEQGQQ